MSSKHIAIIPARAGSKSIIDKNLICLPDQRGKNITRITVESALNAKIFSHVLLTTDISKTKINLDGLTGHAMTKFECITRPDHLCKDDSLMIDVIKHAMNYLGNAYEYVWLLQPTSPLREQRSYQAIQRVMESGEYGSVISFKEVHEHPNRCYTVKSDAKDGLLKAHPIRYTNFSNKEDLEHIFIRSGNFYVSRKDSIKEFSTFENKPIFPHIVDRITGSNIDGDEDLALLKYYLNKGTAKL